MPQLFSDTHNVYFSFSLSLSFTHSDTYLEGLGLFFSVCFIRSTHTQHTWRAVYRKTNAAGADVFLAAHWIKRPNRFFLPLLPSELHNGVNQTATYDTVGGIFNLGRVYYVLGEFQQSVFYNFKTKNTYLFFNLIFRSWYQTLLFF